MRTFEVTTLGCKVNTYDTSLLEKRLSGKGLLRLDESQGQKAQIHIINSCAVTEKSSLETHRLVKKLKAKNPECTVVVTGCVAQVDVDRLKTLTGADLIIGNSHKSQIEKILEDYLEGRAQERVFHSNIFKLDELEEGGGIESHHSRSFLKIQDGCNSFCSFCIIPYARGKSRSIPVVRLVQRINELYATGFREVILTGIHIGDYEDEGRTLSDLVECVLEQTRMPRIRLSSLEPVEVDEKLFRLYSESDRLCPHFHMSIQSGSTRVLKEMKRKYGQEEIRKFFENVQRHIPHAFIGMDVIAGFPGETEEDFQETYDFLKQSSWSRIHVFPYSLRIGTPAAKRVDHLPLSVIQSRAKKLRDLSRQRYESLLQSQVGQMKQVLVLGKPAHGANGLSRDYWNVAVQESLEGLVPRREYQVKITGIKPSGSTVEDGILLGDMVQA